MKVVCDNCSAVYKVPAEKLTKAVNKATCRNCGHRMLIPRAQPDADPDEQTVVTAVPPTPNVSVSRDSLPRAVAASAAAPAPAGLRAGSPAAAAVAAAASARAAISATTRDDLPLATPMASGRAAPQATRAAPLASPRAAPLAPGPRPGLAAEPALHPPRHRVPTPPTAIDRGVSPSPVSANASPATGWGPGARRTPTPPGSSPAPPPRVSGGHTPAARGAASLPPHAPPAAPRAGTPSGTGRHTPTPISARPHDPGHDLSLAVASTWAALVGSIVLAFLFVLDHPIFLWLGLAMSLGGGAFTLLVLTTGHRGRRPARLVAAAGIATLVAVGAPATLVGAAWFVDQARDAYALNFGDEGALAGQDRVAASTITAPATPPEPEGIAVAEPEPAPTEPEAELEVVEEPVALRPPPKATPSRPTPAPARAAPKPAPAKPAPAPAKPAPPRPAPVSTTAAAPAEAPLAAVPVEAIHVMLSSNVDVKRCFVPLLQSGNLPPRVDVRFDILGSGSAANLRVVQADQQGTELEKCLARTVGAIQFPPTSGSGTTITYPFILQ